MTATEPNKVVAVPLRIEPATIGNADAIAPVHVEFRIVYTHEAMLALEACRGASRANR